MAHSQFDLTKGLDFTGLYQATATAADHNNLVDAATPYTDKGLVLWSVDTAVGVPDVPNASSTTKWKRYIWMRIPHTSVVSPANTVPYFYAWNDSATSVATYLKWQRIQADFTTVNATIAALQAELDASQLDITANGLTANAASSLASTASNNATLALANAATVAGNLSTLNAQVNHVTTGLAPTKAIADSALGFATAAVTPAQMTAAVAVPIATLATKKIYTSENYPIFAPNNGLVANFAHGFSNVVPKYVQWVLVCIAGDAFFETGTEIPLSSIANGDSTATLPFGESANLTNIKLSERNSNLYVITGTGTTTQLAGASWRAKCYYAKE